MITLESAEKFREHVKKHIGKDMQFKVAYVSRLGGDLRGDSIGHILSRFVLECWSNMTVPLLVLENTIIRQNVLNTMLLDISVSNTNQCGIYWINVYNTETSERITSSCSGTCYVFLINTFFERPNEQGK